MSPSKTTNPLSLNIKRMKDYFLEIVQIDSISKKERDMALRLQRDLEDLGATVTFDDAGEAVGGEIGNLIARLPASGPARRPILLSAHMDTVVPGEGIKPICDGDIIRSDGTTILGGDDKSGIAIIIEVLRTLVEKNVAHGEIEIVFTICEEFGLVGVKHLDFSQIHSQYGIVLDCDHARFLFTRSPASDRLEFTVHGVEAHAGVCPEQGISAIQIAADAISRMSLGRIDTETTANIGVIQGGAAVNIVPKTVVVRAESRSHDRDKLVAQTQHMRACFQEAVEKYSIDIDGMRITGKVEENIWRDYNSIALEESSPIVEAVLQAAERCGYNVQTNATGGGCDANIFNEKGITVPNLGTGMHQIHTVREWVSLSEMTQTAHVVFEVVKTF
ncbi:MAG: M20/M25/M40 family metallo-hydrolase [Nitrospiria bacterium]